VREMKTRISGQIQETSGKYGAHFFMVLSL
jgi:hypothetical protein